MFIRVSRFSRNVAILLTHEGLGNKTPLFPLNKATGLLLVRPCARMRTDIFMENDRVLLVGEGNFSFSVALHRLGLNVNITPTCFETRYQDAGKGNIEYLEGNGIPVLLGVDATKLAEHSVLSSERFDKVIFNFPHAGGKMRIERNRELLKQFFMAVGKSLKDGGQVLVTLCNGQGGTFMDSPRRRWDDSWKVTEMAAHGNFLLTSVEPFLWTSFEGYNVTGYRSLEKGFHAEDALVHIFEKSEQPCIKNIAPESKIDSSTLKVNGYTWKQLIADIGSLVESKYTNAYSFHMTIANDGDFDDCEFYVTLYNYAGRIVESAELIDLYKPPLGLKERRTYKINYRSDSLPLYRDRVIDIHQNIIADILEEHLNVTVIR